MKHLGDIRNVNGAEIELVDCITFGSPCQDLSIANGNRKGLAGERSGLFTEAIRVIKEMREHDTKQLQMRGAAFDIRCIHPRFLIWENVIGAYSSNGGEDFRCVLEEFIHIREPQFVVPRCEKWGGCGIIIGDSWSIAWRTMDAQYFGTPQRRRRIALVMDCADRCAGEILFERQGVSGDSEPRIEPWKGIAKKPRECVESGYCATLKVRGGGRDRQQREESRKGCADSGEFVGNTRNVARSDAFLTDRKCQ